MFKASNKLIVLLTCVAIVLGSTNQTDIAKSSEFAQQILRYYIKFLKLNALECKYNVGFTFCSDVDIIVDANKLVPELGLQPVKNANRSIVNQEIQSLEDFSHMISYYMLRGIGDEKYISDKTTWENILEAVHKHKIADDIGGNAAVMAQRSGREGCNTYLGAPMDDYWTKEYTDSVNFISPTNVIRDIHLIIRYYSNDTFWDIEIPRSNRLFVNRDVDNTNPEKAINHYLDNISELPEEKKPQIIAVSGFQLISEIPIMESVSVGLNRRLSSPEFNELMIHTEMAAFSSDNLHSTFLENFVDRIDSIGANEREMVELVEFLRHKAGRDKIDTQVKARMTTNEILDIMREIMDLVDVLEIRMNRLHIHTLTNHILCFDKSIWRGGKYAVTKGIQVSLEVSSGLTKETFSQILDNPDNLASAVEESVTYDTQFGSVTKTRNDLLDKPVFSLHINDKWKCSVGKTVELKIPKRIRGLGDNISSAALVHHKLVKFFEQLEKDEQSDDDSTEHQETDL